MVLEQNQSFNDFLTGGIPIVCHFSVKNLLWPIDGVNGIKLKYKQQKILLALKATNFMRVVDETSAIVANKGNKYVALKIDLIPVS